MVTPGWAEIVQRARQRIKENSLLVMATRNEDEAIKWHRAAWAAQDALQEFLQELEAEQEPK